MTFPESWLPYLHDNVLLYRTLNEGEQAKLRGDTLELVNRLYWEGCAGQTITDEVKVTIAGQASLLLLGLKDYRFDGLHTVLVYPGSFLAESEESEEMEVRLGEAAPDGPVALSWWHSHWAGRRLGDTNVVLHEFAHKMAELGDPELGMPPFVSASTAKKWKKIMNSARRRLESDSVVGEDTLLDPYGAEDLAEFFAVASETFFLQPVELRQDMPAVYNLLVSCYHQDPSLRRVPLELQALSADAAVEYSRHAVEEYTVGIKKYPHRADFYVERAAYLEGLGQIDQAIADLREASRLMTEPEERAETLYELADLLDRAGRSAEAAEVEREAQRLQQ